MNTTSVVDIRHAKKSHQCSWCGELIDIGSQYKRYRYFDGGDAGTVKMHPECLDAADDLATYWNGEIEFRPGDYPRGCSCDFDDDCEVCSARKEATTQE